jgi:hypothetical protein
VTGSRVTRCTSSNLRKTRLRDSASAPPLARTRLWLDTGDRHPFRIGMRQPLDTPLRNGYAPVSTDRLPGGDTRPSLDLFVDRPTPHERGVQGRRRRVINYSLTRPSASRPRGRDGLPGVSQTRLR